MYQYPPHCCIELVQRYLTHHHAYQIVILLSCCPRDHEEEPIPKRHGLSNQKYRDNQRRKKIELIHTT